MWLTWLKWRYDFTVRPASTASQSTKSISVCMRFSDEFWGELKPKECQVNLSMASCLWRPKLKQSQKREASIQFEMEPVEDNPLFKMVSRCSVAFSGHGLSFFQSVLRDLLLVLFSQVTTQCILSEQVNFWDLWVVTVFCSVTRNIQTTTGNYFMWRIQQCLHTQTEKNPQFPTVNMLFNKQDAAAKNKILEEHQVFVISWVFFFFGRLIVKFTYEA